MVGYADAGFWDAIAEGYAKKPLPNPEATARKLEITRGLLRPTDRLLDVGCGTGSIALELAPHVGSALGLDLSPAMIEIANRKAAAVSAPNVRFQAAPAGGLDHFADASFEAVCAYNILHLVEDPLALARSISRVLSPGGVFVSSTPCLGGSWFPPYGLILPVMRWVGKAPAVQLLRASELREILAEAGFTEVEAPEVGDSKAALFLTARKPR